MSILPSKNKSSVKIHSQIPLIPVRDVVVFPGSEVILTFGRRKSVLAINHALAEKKLVAIFTQKKPVLNNPTIQDIYSVGTLCLIERTLKSDGELNVLIHGLARISITNVIHTDPFFLVDVQELVDKTEDSEEVKALTNHLTNLYRQAVNLGKSVEFLHFMKLMSGLQPSELADQIAFTLNISLSDKQKILEELDVKKRLYQVNKFLSKEVKILEIERRIASKTQEKFSKSMREAVLRERIQTIKKELGEIDDTETEIDELRKKITKLPLPSTSKQKVLKELQRLTRLPAHSPEVNYLRTWLETVVDLPWGKLTRDRVSLQKAAQILDKDHYGLQEVKDRILEYLAVLKLKKANHSTSALPTIICFVGPPGVGKTSMGRSIAKALNRRFVKVSLGGIRDEAEIRGHRRTYIGAMPGRIIAGIKQAGSSNPVFMLDEIDKIGTDFRGDPSAALLEALDPEQNKEFSDHYLEIPYDLSQVLFITTANVLDTIPPALRDRLEIIRFTGYTSTDKYFIAKNHLLPKVIDKNALSSSDLRLTKPTLLKIIKLYTREAGVRELERQLSKIARKIALAKAQNSPLPKPTTKNLSDFLGPEKYLATLAERTDRVGIATGLAWTPVGGEVLFIEVAIMPGKGNLQITGQLGDVMRESVQAALSYIRSHYRRFGLKKDFYKDIDIHVHVPEGAVPKDGPSAGITITTALLSALTKTKVKKDVGMTGEITLRGRVLEIGGLKEKMIAAYSAGLKEIIFPKDNLKDLDKIPAEVKDNLRLHPVSEISQVFSLALQKS